MRNLLFPVLLILMLMTGRPVQAEPAGDEVLTSGETWLQLIDTGKYADSWKQASSIFRAQIEEPKWEEAVKSARGQFGSLKSRNVKKVTRTKSLPGVPDGDYAVIQFQSDFSNKSQAIETLTLMLDQGHWETAGYFIR